MISRSAISRRKFVGFAFRRGRSVFTPRCYGSKSLEDQRKAAANKGPGVLDSIAKEAIRSGRKRLQTIRSLKEHL